MIDWTQPVETDETPPRPVRVLATDGPCKKFPVIAVVGNAFHREFSLDGRQDVAAHLIPLTLRNVPAKPVRYERWMNRYANGDVDGGYCSEHSAHFGGVASCRNDHVDCFRHVWNSDGSPAEDAAPEWKAKAEALQAEVDRLREVLDHNITERKKACDERDYWKAKAETLQAEVDNLKLLNGTQLTRIGMLKTEVDNLSSAGLIVALKSQAKQLQAEVGRMKPVVDEAVAGVDSFTRFGLMSLREAVRAYQNQPCPTCEGGMIYLKRTQCPDCNGTGKKENAP